MNYMIGQGLLLEENLLESSSSFSLYKSQPEAIAGGVPVNCARDIMKRRRISTVGGVRKKRRLSKPPMRTKMPKLEMKHQEVAYDELIGASAVWGAATDANPKAGDFPASQACLFAPALGTAANQRIGKSVTLHRLKIKGSIVVPPDNTGGTGMEPAVQVRLILFLDKQNNGAVTTTPSDLIDSTVYIVGSDTYIDNFQNVDNFGRFRVLKDKIFNLQDPNILGTAGATPTNVLSNGKIVHFKWTIKFPKGLPFRFNAGTTQVNSALSENSLFMLANMNTNLGTPLLKYRCRSSYTDG